MLINRISCTALLLAATAACDTTVTNPVSAQVGMTMDLTASILSAAGVEPPASYRGDGIDLLPLLKERRTVERTLFWRIKSATRAQTAVRRGRWKYLREGSYSAFDSAEFIFDLEQDPAERHNLAAERADMLPLFRALLDEWQREW